MTRARDMANLGSQAASGLDASDITTGTLGNTVQDNVTRLGTVTVGSIGSGVTGYTGPKVAEMWRVDTAFAGSVDPIIEWEASGTGSDGSNGAANFSSTMTESGGVFTFPQTGYYLIQFNFAGYSSSSTDSRYNQAYIKGSVNAAGAADYVGIALGNQFVHGIAHGVHFNSTCQAIMDVTAVADVKVRFSVTMAGSVNADTSANNNSLHVLFLRLGDT